MSITITQTTNQLDSSASLYFPHSLNKPSYNRCLSTEYNHYIDFKYIYNVYTIDGLIYTIRKSPVLDGYGEFNPEKILQTYLDDTLLYETTPEYKDMFLEYRVSVQEYYDGSLQGTEIFFSDKSLGANYLYNFNSTIKPYKIENTDETRFLCMNKEDVWYKQQLDSKSNWVFIPDNSGDYIYYDVYYNFSGGTIKYIYAIYITPDYEFDPLSTTIVSTEHSGISLPIGFGTLRESIVQKIGYYDENNIYHSTTGTQTGIDSNMSDEYIREKMVVYVKSGSTSITGEYKFQLTCDNVRTATINWINVYGGQDFFNFEKFEEDTIKSNKSVYMKDSYDITSGKRIDSTLVGNFEIYNNIRTYEIELTTNLLTEAEIELLKGLWISNKVELELDGEILPVVSLDNSKKIPSLEIDKKFYYKIKVLYSKNI